MPRVALIADSHFDASSRFEETVRIHDWIADDMAARGVDLVLHGGDIYERKSTPEERRAVVAWVQRVTMYAPLVIVKGNHDADRDLEILARLETDHPVIVEEGAGVHVVGGCVVGCMAWPRKASVLALARQHVLTHAEGELLAGEALRAVLRGLGQQMHEVCGSRYTFDAPKILLAHAMVRGSKTSTGQPLVGCDLELGLDDLLLANATAVFLGHIHMPQEWPGIVYPGSPRRTAYGEMEEKGYVIAEFDGGGVWNWERVPTPCAPMMLVEEKWASDGREAGWLHTAGPAHWGNTEGAEVRFRYEVAVDQRDAARAAAEETRRELLELGAVDVKIEERVLSVSTARSPEVAAASTLADKLHALWNARGTTPDEARAARLVGKANDLEREQHAV